LISPACFTRPDCFEFEIAGLYRAAKGNLNEPKPFAAVHRLFGSEEGRFFRLFSSSFIFAFSRLQFSLFRQVAFFFLLCGFFVLS
jgi:hypothetical protein